MARADLIALSEDGLVQLSNAGLVRRASRDLAAGNGPALEEAADGTVEAHFADGVVTRLTPGRQLADATCGCPASGMCRHRVMLALAYKAQGGNGATPTEAAQAWDPATLDLDAFEASFTPSIRSEMTRLLAMRIDVRLERGPQPSARLPMATVKFLVPGDVGYARCDCAQGLRCAHVALAIRAFRGADGAAEATVGTFGERAAPSGPDELRDAVDAVLARLLEVGVVAGPAAHAQAIFRARAAAEAAGAVHLALGLDALAEQIDAYEARSARHDELACLALAAELHARPRAADRTKTLGIGEPMETAMGKARLISLGARLSAEGEDVRVMLLLADSDTGATMLLEKLFSPLPSEAGRLVETILRRQFVPGLAVVTTARGQILTRAARRRADGLLALGSGARGRTALAPRDAVFAFAPPLKVLDAGALAARFAGRPPSFLRPRRRIDEVHVFEINEVLGQAWTSGSQLWQAAATLKDDGGTLYLERSYDAGAPRALDILSSAFEGRYGRLRQVAGPVRVEGDALVCEPWSLGADRFIVPDIDAADEAPAPAPSVALARPSTSPDRARHLLASALHAGRRARDGIAAKQAAEVAAALDAAGYRATAGRLRVWTASEAGDAVPFGEAAVWLAALMEDES
jgi:hypothetical protein